MGTLRFQFINEQFLSGSRPPQGMKSTVYPSRSDGVLECWRNGLKKIVSPLRQHSIIPIFKINRQDTTG